MQRALGPQSQDLAQQSFRTEPLLEDSAWIMTKWCGIDLRRAFCTARNSTSMRWLVWPFLSSFRCSTVVTMSPPSMTKKRLGRMWTSMVDMDVAWHWPQHIFCRGRNGPMFYPRSLATFATRHGKTVVTSFGAAFSIAFVFIHCESTKNIWRIYCIQSSKMF